MKKQTSKISVFLHIENWPIMKCFYILFFLVIFFSCSQQQEQQTVLSNQAIQIPTVKPEDLPPPIKAKYLDRDSVAPPAEIPLKYEPKVVSAHPNVHPIGSSKVTQIPNELHIVTLGKDVPMPEVISAKPKVTPAFQPEAIPALASRMRDAAINDLQYLSEDEGLPFGGKTIMEDSRGHIWLGAGGGAVRYDGQNFFPFTQREGIFSGINLMEDSKGNIWFGGFNGGGYYNGKQVIDFREQEGLKNNLWNALLEDKEGNIWIGTDKGIFKFDGQNFTFFKKENGLLNDVRKETGGFFDNRINAILEDSQGDFWWATQGSGVLRFDPDSDRGQIIHYTEKEGLISNYIRCILEDSQGQIWFGSGGQGTTNIQAKGISIYRRDATGPQSLGGTFTNYTTKEGLSDNRITGMVEDDQGKIWLATYGKGLSCYDPHKGKGSFIHFTTEEGLSHNSVLSILKDSKKNIWIGLNNDREIMRFKPNSFRHFTEQQGLGRNWITKILEDGKENIWMGSAYGGLVKYDGQNFIHFSEKEDLLNDLPRPILGDKQGNIWIITRDKGIMKFDGKVFKLFGKEQGFPYPDYFHAHQDKQGNIWINNGSARERQVMLIRYNPETGQVAHFETERKEKIGTAFIFEDQQQQLWFDGIGCIAKYDAINDQLNYVLQLDTKKPRMVSILFEDDTDNIWLTDPMRNLIKLKKNGAYSTIPVFLKEQVFPNVNPVSLTVDRNKRIWVSTSTNGIGVLPNGAEGLSLPQPAWIWYNKKDGLKSLHYTTAGSYIDSKNRYWASSTDAGVTMLDLNTFELPSEAPKNLSLSHLDIQQRSIDFARLSDTTYSNRLAFGAALNETFDSVSAFKNYPTNLNLPYNLNHLTFHFAAIDWDAPHDIRYSYKIEGLDKEWSPLSAKAEADYRNIPYGNYTFKVKAIGKAQVWSQPFEYTFTILPPWWHTWWARALYVIAGLLLILGLIRWRTYTLRKRQKELEKTVKERTAEVVAKNEVIQKEKDRSDELLLNILPSETAEELKQYGTAKAKNYDTVTVLFTDFKNFTGHSERMSPVELVSEIDHCFKAFDQIMEQYRVEKIKTVGDAYLAAAGLPTPNNTNSVDGTKAALAIRDFMIQYQKLRKEEGRDAFEVRIGVHSGPVVAGIVGIKKFAYDIWGDTVNLASRMESSGEVGKVNISQSTYELLKDHPGFKFESRGKIKAKNKGELEMYFVERAS